MSYGATSVALRRLAGRDVFITLDPEDCSTCVAYTAEREGRRYIDRLQCNQRIPANASVGQLREAIASQRRRNKHFDRAQREAPKRTRAVAHEVAALRSEQRAEALRATGTEDNRPRANVRPVRTGFEAVSTPDRRAARVDYGNDDLSCLFTESPKATEPEDDGSLEDLVSDRAAVHWSLGDLNAAIEAKEKPAVPDDIWSRLHEFVNNEGAETPGMDADQGESV